MSHTGKYTKEKLEIIVKDCYSMSDVLRKLGIKHSGGMFDHIKHKIEKYGIDTKHFLGNTSNKGKVFPRKNDEEVFVENSTYGRNHLKRRILQQNLIEYKCDICGLGPEWQGKPMVLLLDHINGKNDDHRIENLRFVCSNCDTQLITYKNKYRKNGIVKAQ